MEIKRYKITHLRNAVEWHYERYEMARRVLVGSSGGFLSKRKAKLILSEEKAFLDSVLGENYV